MSLRTSNPQQMGCTTKIILSLFLRVIAVPLFFRNFHATYVVEDSYDISINTFVSCFVVADRA